MTVRTDITVDFELNPRLITIAAPSVEISIQDLVDTLRTIEDRVESMDNPHLINAAGKEPLGSGTLVGITATFQNAQLSFETRDSELESGTVTTLDVTGVTLTDTTATFITNGVGRGDQVFNRTDGSSASVLSVTSETVLVTDVLSGGIDNQFAVSDAYEVYDVVQCNISGGNLVAVDSLGADLAPVFPTFGVQIVRTASSSATLQELLDIQHASFGHAVWVDNVNGSPGTVFPRGTSRDPVDNIPDAALIANSRGLAQVRFESNFTLDTGDVLDDFTLIGRGIGSTKITVNPGASVINSVFRDMVLNGTLDGGNTIVNASVMNLTYLNGTIHDTMVMAGTISLAGGVNSMLANTHTGTTKGVKPIIDMGGSGQSLSIRQHDGHIKITNKTGAGDTCIIDMSSGEIELDSTVTAGTVVLRGIAELIDNSVGATVVNQLLSGSRQILIEKITRNKLITDPVTGVMTVFDDDGTTVLLSGNIFEDAGGTQAYQGKGAERRERLA